MSTFYELDRSCGYVDDRQYGPSGSYIEYSSSHEDSHDLLNLLVLLCDTKSIEAIVWNLMSIDSRHFEECGSMYRGAEDEEFTVTGNALIGEDT